MFSPAATVLSVVSAVFAPAETMLRRSEGLFAWVGGEFAGGKSELRRSARMFAGNKTMFVRVETVFRTVVKRVLACRECVMKRRERVTDRLGYVLWL